MSAMNTLLTILRRQIDEKRITVAEIAAHCECSRQHIYQIMKEDQAPSLPLAEKIAEALGAEFTVKTKRRQRISA